MGYDILIERDVRSSLERRGQMDDYPVGIPIKRPDRIGSVLLRGIEIAGRKELFGLIVIDGDWIKINLREEQRRAAVLYRNTPNNEELKERLEMLGQFHEVLIQREDVEAIFLCRDGSFSHIPSNGPTALE